MLTVCYSPKGGQGCTTVTAALALAQRGARLIDTTGDLPAVLGLPDTSGPGICDLLADDQPLEFAAIERLATSSPTPLVHRGVHTRSRGGGGSVGRARRHPDR